MTVVKQLRQYRRQTAILPPYFGLTSYPCRKVQRVPCVRAQRPEWFCFISWYSPTVTLQRMHTHSLTHTHTHTHTYTHTERHIAVAASALPSAHWPSASPEVLGMTHKQHTVQQYPKLRIRGYNMVTNHSKATYSAATVRPVHTVQPHHKYHGSVFNEARNAAITSPVQLSWSMTYNLIHQMFPRGTIRKFYLNFIWFLFFFFPPSLSFILQIVASLINQPNEHFHVIGFLNDVKTLSDDR